MVSSVSDGKRTTLHVNHRFEPELRRRLEEHIRRENERSAPAKVSIRAVINTAVREYLDREEGES
jgi:hypothetical protein